ncbi:MAG: glutamine-hydrolyzing GMP synthase [Chitinivibrionales bacterium]|nr:glutamine-hydrolyzing GMP synthase [Chitinivibrionales bacterium]MBD3396969.1 glutamine-hydrolyzing GMP synthase [Chitinivibrionales bacterium]
MDTIAVLDFGGQYTHLIANRIRRLGVFSEIVPCHAPASDLRPFKGIILSGGPYSVLDPGSPTVEAEVFTLGIPVLGLCYGHQLMASLLGGGVCKGKVREYGTARIAITEESALFAGLDTDQVVWMSHGDTVDRLPEGFAVLASSEDCSTAAVGDASRRLYGLQFHPEVTHTPNGMTILDNFIGICGCRREWSAEFFLKEMTAGIEKQCNGRNVFLLVSGGVDSTVAFALLNETLGPERVLGLHIDTGLMRLDESDDILAYLREHGFNNLHIVDASRRFLATLGNIADPEEKRAIIGKLFIEVQQAALAERGLNAEKWMLGQGTIYPDTIESAGTEHADRIKTHHNRVDIILELLRKGLVLEPLSQLYKDEVRALGEELGLPHKLVWRHPFPGPGLGVRALCSDGAHQPVDSSVEDQTVRLAGALGYAARVLPVHSVGVQGDGRTYAHPALVTGPRDWEALERVSTRITNAVRGVNRVVYGLRVKKPEDGYRVEKAFLTRDRLDKLRKIDHAVTEALYASEEYDAVWQMPVVLLPLVNCDNEECVVLRPIMSQEAMTARFAPLSEPALNAIIESARAIDGVGDVFFDVTHKPPGTIEWE